MFAAFDIPSPKPEAPPRGSSRFGADVTDGELVVRAQAGDRWAQEALFRRYVTYVTRLAIRLMSRRQDADDVVQEAFADALESLSKLRDPDAFRSWLTRIVVNRSRKAYRRRKFARAFGLDGEEDDAALAKLASGSVSPDVVAELSKVDAVLRTLSTEQRTAWLLRYVQQETLESVAALTGCSLATAKRRVAAARTVIEARLRRSDHDVV